MFSTIPEDGIWPLEKNLFKKADKGGASSLEQELKIEALMPTRTSLWGYVSSTRNNWTLLKEQLNLTAQLKECVEWYEVEWFEEKEM